jgi:hypothetical protein
MRQNLLAVVIFAAPLSACMVLSGTDHPVADDATAKATISGLRAPGYVWLHVPDGEFAKGSAQHRGMVASVRVDGDCVGKVGEGEDLSRNTGSKRPVAETIRSPFGQPSAAS